MTDVFSQQGTATSPCPAGWPCQPRRRGARSCRLRNRVCHRESVRQTWLRNKMGYHPVTLTHHARRSIHHTVRALGQRCSSVHTHFSGTYRKVFDFKVFSWPFPAG